MKTFLLIFSLLLTISPLSAQSLTANERRSFKIALERYPDLSNKRSPHYRAFEKLLDQSIKADSVVFKNPNWPLMIAERSRACLPATRQGRRKFGRTDTEKFGGSTSKIPSLIVPKVKLENTSHHLKKIIKQGQTIQLDNNTIWTINPLNIVDAILWLPSEKITITRSDNPLYPYKLINIHDKTTAEAKLIAQ